MNSSEFFNVIDYICLLILFVSVFSGFLKGFTKDFFGTCSWICSLFLSIFLAPYLVPILQENIPILEKCAFFVKCTIALVIIFSILLIIFKIIVNTLSREVKATCLSGVDRLFGAIFGLCRGLGTLLCMAILSLLFGVQQERYGIVRESKIATISYRLARKLMPKIRHTTDKRELNQHEKRIISAKDFSKVPIKKKTEKEEKGIVNYFSDYITDIFSRYGFNSWFNDEVDHVRNKNTQKRQRTKELYKCRQ